MRVGGWARKHPWWLGAAGVLLGLLVAFWVLLGTPWPRGWPSSIGEISMSFAQYPRLLIQSNMANCGSNHVIDADGRSWHESGCEARSSGWRQGERMDPARVQRLQQALAEFSKVPDAELDAYPCKPVEYQGVSVRLSLRFDEHRSRDWWICPEPAQRPPKVAALWQAIYP